MEELEKKVLETFFALSRKLTGHDWVGSKPSYNLEEVIFGGDVFYLSDCGYSRVWYNYDDNELYLTSNSRDEVKKAWPDALQERNAFSLAIKNWISSL